MTPERFQQIEELYHAAREGSAAERLALLSQADPELRREVESLLAVGSGGEFMERPAFENAPQLLEDLTGTEWAAGTLLGPYQIESKLGQGGMGQVFRAVDTRLGRAVAIKITYQQFSSRFEREARAISSLNHPNICTLYDVGPNYLVMELVEGETLAARLKQGPLSIEKVRHYGGQIAAALAEAHAKGIVHREPGEEVRPYARGNRLSGRRYARPGTDPGRRQRTCVECIGNGRGEHARQAGRIAQLDSEAKPTAGTGHDCFAGSSTELHRGSCRDGEEPDCSRHCVV
jgi:hypothetical protein